MIGAHIPEDLQEAIDVIYHFYCAPGLVLPKRVLSGQLSEGKRGI